jgi:hypothetical protein
MTRTLLEQYTVAWNTPLKETVQVMDYVTLLRNVHPFYRASFATTLLNEKVITREEASEFVKLVGQ